MTYQNISFSSHCEQETKVLFKTNEISNESYFIKESWLILPRNST